MDYILEEMMRQRRIMESLLSAEVREKQEEEQNTAYPILRRRERTAFDRVRYSTGAAEESGSERGLETAEAERVFRAGRHRRGESVPVRHSRAQQTAAAENATVESEVLVLPAENFGARLAAQEVSRIVQREARRYDSGFEM